MQGVIEMKSLMITLAILAFTGTAGAQEDAVPGSPIAQDTEPRSQSRSGREGSAAGRYALEALEKLGWGAADVGMTVPEVVATPFRNGYWADRTKRPVIPFFLMGIGEGFMTGGMRFVEGCGSILTFPIAAEHNRFADFSLWYWRRHDGVDLPWFHSAPISQTTE